MSEFIKVTNHENKPIDLSHLGAAAVELRPTELHYNNNGSVDDKPTLAIVLEHPGLPQKIYGQFSLKTLQDCLLELGMATVPKSYLDMMEEGNEERVQCRNYLMGVKPENLSIETALEELGYGRDGLGW